MATETIRIVIDIRGDRAVKRKLGAVGGKAKQARGQVNLLKTALLGFGAGAIIRGIIQTADSYRFIQNRLRVVTKSSAELAVVTKKLFEVSRETRFSFQDTVEIYSRLAIASTDLGTAQAEVIRIVEDLNKIVRISGTRVKEASNAMIQLSQGIASNTLRGDELRAVLEQLPLLARFIGKELGVSFGRVRELAAEGKITADVIFKALQRSRSIIAERFEKVIPTISESFLKLRDSFTLWLGEMDTAKGGSEALSRLLLKMADNFDTVAKAATGAGLAIGLFAGRAGVGAAIGAVKKLGALLVAGGPWGAVIGILAIAGSFMFAFRDDITITTDKMLTLGDLLNAIWATFKDNLGGIVSGLKRLSNFLTGVQGDLVTVAEAGRTLHEETAAIELFDLHGTAEVASRGFLGILLLAARFADDFVSVFIALGKLIVGVWNGMWFGLFSIAAIGVDRLTKFIEDELNKILGKYEELRDKLQGTRFENILPELGTFDFATHLQEGLGEGPMSFAQLWDEISGTFVGDTAFKAIENELEKLVTRASNFGLSRRIQEAIDAKGIGAPSEVKGKNLLDEDPSGGKAPRITFEIIRQGLERENELLRMGVAEREIANSMDKIRADLLGQGVNEAQFETLETMLLQNQTLERQNALYEQITGPLDEIQMKQQTLNELLEQGRITGEQWLTQMRGLNAEMSILDGSSFFDGIRNGFDRIIESTDDLAQSVSNTVVSAFDELANVIIRVADSNTSLKDSFLQMANVVVAQLLRIAIQMLILKALGFAGFGPSTSVTSTLGTGTVVPDFGSGIKAQHGAQFNVGGQGGPDSQMVNFMASPAERVTVETPDQQRKSDSAGGSAPQVNVKIVNVDDPQAMIGAMEGEEGDQLIMNFIERNRSTVTSILGDV